MRHHVGRLLNVIDSHLEVPFLVKSGTLHPTDEYIRPDARYVIHQLRLEKQVLSRQQKVANIVLRRAYRDAITDA